MPLGRHSDSAADPSKGASRILPGKPKGTVTVGYVYIYIYIYAREIATAIDIAIVGLHRWQKPWPTGPRVVHTGGVPAGGSPKQPDSHENQGSYPPWLQHHHSP